MAAIDYRLSGEARFPAPLEDVRAAIGWVGEHAAGYGLDTGRVFLWGDSAGGHLALLAALTGATAHGGSRGSRSPTWPACRPTWPGPAAFLTPDRNPARRCSWARPPPQFLTWPGRPAR